MLGAAVNKNIWESNTCVVCENVAEQRAVLSCSGMCVLSVVARHRGGTVIAAGGVKCVLCGCV